METKLKVIIADDTTEFGNNCSNVLKSYGMETVLCQKDGLKLLKMIIDTSPDIVLADIFMPNLDILGVLAELKNSNIK
ncbi:MAG: response regulator, partial [bacterium]|nr:response regulator [bacterium]